MTLDQIIAFATLAGALVLFATGWLRFDLVAVLAMVVVTIAGLVPADEALEGFGHPAVITVAAVLIISRALQNSGVVDVVSARLAPFTERPVMHIAVLTGACALASSVMNNVGAIAIFLPVAMTSAAARSRPPSMILMPLAFGSILGGLMTQIGTPPNIIIAQYRAGLTGGVPFGMFDFSPVGVPVAIAGVLFVALIGWRLIPKDRRGAASHAERFKISDYITEVRVKEESPLAGKRITHVEHLTGDEVVVTGRVTGNNRVTRPARWEPVNAGDILVLKADPAELKPKMDDLGLELVADAPGAEELLQSETVQLVEAVVSPQSVLDGATAAGLRRRSGDTLNLIALARPGEDVTRRLRNARIRAGDVLLMQSVDQASADVIRDLGLLLLPERGLTLGEPRRVPVALAIFAAAIAVNALGLVPIAIAFLAAILGFVLAEILQPRELYRYIDWRVIVLLGAMIPVGQALEATGAAALVADGIVAATGTFPAWVALTLILVVTMFLSDIINNAATALVMAPISVATASALGVNADPFLMSVALGASCAFLTPIGHQSNTLVMGPAGYEFGDYWRMGLPLEAIIVAAGVPLILWAWPL